jgi:hypothetical protein
MSSWPLPQIVRDGQHRRSGSNLPSYYSVSQFRNNNWPFEEQSHRKHDVSATKPNRLMLFREIIAVYCENRTEHINMLRKVSRSYITSLVNIEAFNNSVTILSDNLNTLKHSSFPWKILRRDAALLNVLI